MIDFSAFMDRLRTLFGGASEREATYEEPSLPVSAKTSPKERYAVQVQLEDGSVVDGEVVTFTRYGSADVRGGCCIRLRIEGRGEFEAESYHYFDALIKLRGELDERQIKLLCFGARRDVWASGMQCDMGMGLNAYLLSARTGPRKPAGFIFDYAPPETIGTVEEQMRYGGRGPGPEVSPPAPQPYYDGSDQ